MHEHSLIVCGPTINTENIIVASLYRRLVLRGGGVVGGLLRAHGASPAINNMQDMVDR